MTQRAVVAMMEHETNTFSPVPTALERFNPVTGPDVMKRFKGTGLGLGARFYKICCNMLCPRPQWADCPCRGVYYYNMS